MRKQILVCSMGLSMMALAGCSDKDDVRASEAQTPNPATYNTNMTSTDDVTNSEYEISDMLPRPSDDTFVISVEDAEALMKNRQNTADALDAELYEEDEQTAD